jgi:outer membrane protein OmpA-like peptidoglycan-associated protein
MLKRPLLKITPILIGMTLAGCATQKSYVPELEQAQQTYAQISQDPIVASLAGEELQAAGKQLRRAEDAAAAFRKPQSVAHEAQLATLQTLTAQQRARSLTANHSVQMALGQDPLLSEQQIASATIIETPLIDSPFGAEPIMAAAHAGGDIQAQLASLSQQLASLQAQLAASQQAMVPAVAEPAPVITNLQTSVTPDPVPAISGTATAPATAAQVPPVAAAPQATDQQLLAPDSLQLTPQYQLEPILDAGAQVAQQQSDYQVIPEVLQTESQQAEPAIGAAIAAPATTAVKALPGQEQIHRKLMAMNAKPNTRGMSLTLGERYFEGGTAGLMNQRAARHLDNVAAVLQQNPGLTLDIEGHTDDQATPENSQDLSVNRAISIKSALVLRGIDAGRIDTRGFGHTRPVADNESPLGRLQNRRVELVFPVSQLGG